MDSFDHPRILVADDENNLRDMVCQYLSKTGFQAVPARNSQEVRRLLAQQPFDVLVLDVMMPGEDGFTLARDLWQSQSIPIVFMTAKVAEADRVAGLEEGADDYICKPFSLRELAARLRVVARRSKFAQIPERKVKRGQPWKDLVVDLEGFLVWKNGEPLELTTGQFRVFAWLFAHPGRVFRRAQILAAIRDERFDGSDRIIDVHVKNLRQILGDDARSPRYIETVRSIGYRLGS